MKSLYASPFRVYLFLGILALVGIFAGAQLPVSLFPNSSKPTIGIWVPYGSSTPDEFLNSYGSTFESLLRSVTSDTVQLETIQAYYERDGAYYNLEFRWGNSPVTAFKEVQLIANSFSSRLPDEIRDSVNVWTNQENNGFLALSFYSDTRSLDDLYNYLEPLLVPQVSKVTDAADTELWNPTRKEVRVELSPDRVAALQLFPRDIERATTNALNGYAGGSITLGTQQLAIQLVRPVRNLNDLSKVVIPTRSGRAVHLSDVARVDYGLKMTNARSFKTSGQPSLILFATPKAGGNVKRMSEEILDIVRKLAPSFPKDVQYRIIVDPSEFIRGAINNVFHEVAIGALLAVAILFLFIGSIKNTITAAIEIPLSMVLAFILMKLSGMNLNLISLGGLALSAGMNVDASVVVMENIFRHFEEHPGKLTFLERLEIIVEAVKEVRFAVIASTIASLVVFLPLAFTSDLSYAILGDLAKTVVFSHGFSAFVALILVPTVRLHLMRGGIEKPFVSPIDRHIRGLENWYGNSLRRFIISSKLKKLSYAGLLGILVVLLLLVLPNLPKEVIGTPDTDWMYVGVNTKGNTLLRQMESQIDEIETDLLKAFGGKIQYTFTQINGPNRASVMARLKNKKEMRPIWKELETKFPNTPFLRFSIGPWNPAELPIPNPPQLRLVVRGGSVDERAQVAEDIRNAFEEKQVLPRLWTEPDVGRTESIVLRANPEQWAALAGQGADIGPSDLADLARVATSGRRIGSMVVNDRNTDIFLLYPQGTVNNPEELGALPVGLGSRLVPFKALAQVAIEKLPPTLYREDGREQFVIFGRQNESAEGKGDKDFLKKAKLVVEKWEKDQASGKDASRDKQGSTTSVFFEDAEKDLTTALHQLAWAVGLSVALIFITLILQFGNLMNAALVLVAVPLGFIGVLVSLFVFRSTLSLNSVLGVILLNGIAVANSIILVDFLKRLVERGFSPEEAAVEAGRKRLRPILITSLTTILGMLPIAVGMGEGGRILQPLGIAVSGGLWVSMGLTLFVVPALQVSYLNWQSRRKGTGKAGKAPAALATTSLLLALLFSYPAATPASAADSPAPMAFSDAMGRIIDRSISLQTQQSRAQSTQAQNLPTRLFYLPTVSVAAAQQETRTGTGPRETSTTLPQLTGTANLNLFKFGADVAAYRAATQDETAQNALTDSTLLAAEQTAVEALVVVIQRRKETQIHEQLVQIETELHRIAQQRFERGLLPRQEVDTVAIDLANEKSRLADAKTQEVAARSTLIALLGSDNVEIAWPWRDPLMKQDFKPILDDSAFSLNRRPDWLAAQAQLNAEDQRLSRTHRLLFPSLDANLTYGYYFPRTQDSYPSWTGTLTLSLPLFDRLQNYSNIRVQSYNYRIAELSLENTRRNATSEWLSVKSAFETTRQSAIAREQTLGIARNLYEDNKKRFQQGRISTNDLFVDQRRLFDTESLTVQTWASAHVELARLCHALARRVGDCLSGAAQ